MTTTNAVMIDQNVAEAATYSCVIVELVTKGFIAKDVEMVENYVINEEI